MTACLIASSLFSAETRGDREIVWRGQVGIKELGNAGKEGGSEHRGQTAEADKNLKMILSLK